MSSQFHTALLFTPADDRRLESVCLVYITSLIVTDVWLMSLLRVNNYRALGLSHYVLKINGVLVTCSCSENRSFVGNNSGDVSTSFHMRMAIFAVPETLRCFWSTKRRMKFRKLGSERLRFHKQHGRWTNVPCLKIINASPAYVLRHQNLKRKPYNCNSNIHFNEKCLRNNIVPKFAKINIPNTSSASKFTQHKASTLRLKNGIRYL
jgi:hypothetical protein